jgi:L-lactate dehydrogenase complex protein LldG
VTATASAVVSDRKLILGRIRAALADVPETATATEPSAWAREHDPDPAAAYRTDTASLGVPGPDRFAERCADYTANVVGCARDDQAIAAAVGNAIARHRARTLVAPPGWPAAWIPDGVTPRSDEPPLGLDVLQQLDGVLSGCALAIAETGTIVLDGGPGQGRRVLTLVPDLHVCVVRAEQIVPGVPEAIAALGTSVAHDGRPITFISGPSATSDIGLERVEGVHGPRRLEVIVAGLSRTVSGEGAAHRSRARPSAARSGRGARRTARSPR